MKKENQWSSTHKSITSKPNNIVVAEFSYSGNKPVKVLSSSCGCTSAIYNAKTKLLNLKINIGSRPKHFSKDVKSWSKNIHAKVKVGTQEIKFTVNVKISQ
jgi:hypothetical protein